MQHDARAGQAMDGRVDALRGALDVAGAFERSARFVPYDHVARTRFGPVQPERQDQVAVVAARHGHREMVVDALLEIVQHGETVGRGEVYFRLGQRVEFACGGKRMDGHRAPFGNKHAL